MFLGTKVELLHLRRTEQCRDGEQIEELKPIDRNLQYDFNFQQTIYIDEVIVKPVSGHSDLEINAQNFQRYFIIKFWLEDYV